MKSSAPSRPHKAFSLVEVVLAIGVLSLAIVALLGLFGPTIGSVKQVVDTNLATAAVSRINAEIQRNMDWPKALGYTNTNSGSVFYVWKNQEDVGGDIDFKMSDDPQDLTTDLTNGTLVDTPMAVTFQRGLTKDPTSPQASDTYSAWAANTVDEQGYFPIFVSIYAIEPTTAGDYSVSQLESNFEPIFTYTTAKNRSL